MAQTEQLEERHTRAPSSRACYSTRCRPLCFSTVHNQVLDVQHINFLGRLNVNFFFPLVVSLVRLILNPIGFHLCFIHPIKKEENGTTHQTVTYYHCKIYSDFKDVIK